MNRKFATLAIIWMALFLFSSLAQSQITVKTTYADAGRIIKVTANNIDSVTARYSEIVDISSLDGQTMYYSGYAYATTGGNAHDSCRVAILGYNKVGSNDFYVGLDTFWIPVRSTRDSAESILQTPTLSFTGYAPEVKLQLLSASTDGDGTVSVTPKDIYEVFFTLYSRVEDTVPPMRQLKYITP